MSHDYYYTADEIKKKLDEYLEGAKIKSLGIVCKVRVQKLDVLRNILWHTRVVLATCTC